MTVVAVIDTGTNSTRLLVADAGDGKVREIARRTEVTRLGEGVDKSGRLNRSARARVQRAVDGYAEIIARHNAQRTVILATSSVREAADGEEFLAWLAESHYLSERLLSGAEEAALSYLGATFSLPDRQRIMLFDVGGGSTEIAAGKVGRVDYARSLDIGCVRITERFFKNDPVLPVEADAAAGFINDLLQTKVDPHYLVGIEIAVAVAGTVTSLAAVDLGLKKYDRDAVHGHLLTREKVGALFDRLAGLSLKQRLKINTIEQGRADVIVGGALIVLKLMEYSGIDALTVSENDILDGAALKLAAGEL